MNCQLPLCFIFHELNNVLLNNFGERNCRDYFVFRINICSQKRQRKLLTALNSVILISKTHGKQNHIAKRIRNNNEHSQ